jgi:hypothetical protein
MLVQVVHGRTSDAEALRTALDGWQRDVAPGAEGWLGTTGGTTEDGRFIGMFRFESAEAARRNGERPEQQRWWADTEKLLDGGQATVRTSEDVLVDQQGDPDRAGFVQVMTGATSDPERTKELMAQDPDTWAAFRPDVLGSVTVGHDGGEWTMFMYFTSEADAREGERREAPPELLEAMQEMDKLTVGEFAFLDVRQPVLLSPR